MTDHAPLDLRLRWAASRWLDDHHPQPLLSCATIHLPRGWRLGRSCGGGSWGNYLRRRLDGAPRAPRAFRTDARPRRVRDDAGTLVAVFHDGLGVCAWRA